MEVFEKYAINDYCKILLNFPLLLTTNIGSCRTSRQLSLAIFMAPRTHLVAQKSLIYEKITSKLLNTGKIPPLGRRMARYGVLHESKSSSMRYT